MTTPALQAILRCATTEPAFRAQLLANPALGLTEDRLQALLANPDLAEVELSLEMLEQIAGGPNDAGWLIGGRQGGGGVGG